MKRTVIIIGIIILLIISGGYFVSNLQNKPDQIKRNLTEEQKRNYRLNNLEKYENGTLEHNVSLDDMKERLLKNQFFVQDKNFVPCLSAAEAPKELGQCVSDTIKNLKK